MYLRYGDQFLGLRRADGSGASVLRRRVEHIDPARSAGDLLEWCREKRPIETPTATRSASGCSAHAAAVALPRASDPRAAGLGLWGDPSGSLEISPFANLPEAVLADDLAVVSERPQVASPHIDSHTLAGGAASSNHSRRFPHAK